MKEVPPPCGVQPPPDLAYLPCELTRGHPGGHTFEPAPQDPALREIDGLKNDLAELCEGISELGKVLAEYYGGAGGNHEICAKAARILKDYARCLVSET